MSEGTLVKIKNLPTTTNIKNTDYIVIEQRTGTRKSTVYEFKRNMSLNVDSNEVLGGFHHVETIKDRNAIVDEKRKVGMLCYVVEEDKIYQLVGGKENVNWMVSEFDFTTNSIHIGSEPPADTSMVWVDDEDEHVKGRIEDEVLDAIREALRDVTDKVDDVYYAIKYEIDAGYFTGNLPGTNGDLDDEEDEDEYKPDISDGASGTVNKIILKRGLKKELTDILNEGELGFCIDTEELYIGNKGFNRLIAKVGGVGGSGSSGNVTSKYIELISSSNAKYRVTVNDSGALQVVNSEADTIADPPESDNGRFKGLIINQMYGGGAKDSNTTPVSHGFIELYNNTLNPLNLKGLSLQYGEYLKSWQVLELRGIIQPYSSFLIRCAQHTDINRPSTRFKIKNYDMSWDIPLSDSGMKVYLCVGTTATSYTNPANTDGAWTPATGYIDLLGVGAEDTNRVIDAYEKTFAHYMTKNIGVRRDDFADTGNNFIDIVPVDFRTADVATYMPHYSGDGQWDVYFDKKKLDTHIPNMINMCYGYDGNTSRTFTWQSPVTDKGYLKYKRKEDSKFITVESTRKVVQHPDVDATVHSVIIYDLTPGTYIYKAGEEGRWSDEYEFEVIHPTNDDPIKFLMVTDQQGWNEEEYSAWQKCMNFIGNNEEYDFILNTGDISQNGGAKAFEWRYYYDMTKQHLYNYCHMTTCG